jgi:hypothetical protein
MQSFHRHARQYPVVLCNVPLLVSVTPPNLPCEGRFPVKACPKPGRKSAVGAGRNPLRFWLLLAYTKSDSPQAKCEKSKGERKTGGTLRDGTKCGGGLRANKVRPYNEKCLNAELQIAGRARNDIVGGNDMTRVCGRAKLAPMGKLRK